MTHHPQSSVAELLDRPRKAYADKNHSEAMRWFRIAAEPGICRRAEQNRRPLPARLGSTAGLRRGDGWYQMAAAQGDAPAQVDIGG
jgi:hypothetical protein